MITTKELNEVTLSPTKKDYYQIWNELMDLADKISDRWSPASTNESDPGIVLLKALTAIADKLNYNIDKNTLEAFMPSATQEESMRKLTEMMGYSMKYYQAATTEVNFSFNDTAEKKLSDFGSTGIYFPRFVNIKNSEESINYVTLKAFTLNSTEPTRKITAAEGVLRECETDSDNVISLIHLDDNQRYYFSETNVAENGIFITNIVNNDYEGTEEESSDWQQVSNLNTQLLGSKVFKFGFDSRKQLPYVQFPEDVSHLIKDGLRIKYISTNGASGNITAKTLGTFEVPGLWSSATGEDELIASLVKEDFNISNVTAATNGANPESLDAAYNNYKKTIGTFDTLVTCRDYMNAIYQMTQSETNTTPLVSNIIVSDIRDDINKAVTLCSFNDYGICYSDHSLKKADNTSNQIEHFDLVLYPFKTSTLDTKTSYENSFRYNAENNNKIKYDLEKNKTIAHNFVDPTDNDIICIKNYLRLKARIATTKKVTSTEEAAILDKIYTAIYTNFNSRYIDFGEEIPYDTILAVIKNADPRIKDVNLDEPSLYTKLCTRNNEYDVMAVSAVANDNSDNATKGKELYNKLALRNVLAGRIAAFQYDTNFETDYCEKPYLHAHPANSANHVGTYADIYPNNAGHYITKIESEFLVNPDDFVNNSNWSQDKGLKLQPNQVIQFRMPSLKTTKTFPSYVNYYIKLKASSAQSITEAIPATFDSLRTFLESKESSTTKTYWDLLLKYLKDKSGDNFTNYLRKFETNELETTEKFNTRVDFYGRIFTLTNSAADPVAYITKDNYDADTIGNSQCYCFELKSATIAVLNNWLKSLTINNVKLSGLYRTVGAKLTNSIGKLIDVDLQKYMQVNEFTESSTSYLDRYYVQQTHADKVESNTGHTIDGLGRGGDYTHITKDAEYQLGANEFLLINYTNSSTDNNGTETKTVVNEYYGPGTIIKPNFKLTDSELYNKNHSFSKKDGFYFADEPSIPGMFTLGTDEQICIREIIQVELDENGTNLYWELNSDDKEAASNEFTFDEDYGLDSDRKDKYGYIWGTTDNPVHNAYTLKEGEHIYYTDANKSDLAYYGAGTIVVKTQGTGSLIKYNTSGEEVSEEDIMEHGLTANIPWRTVHLAKKNDVERKITLIENQYLSLTEGDYLKYVGNSNSFAMELNNEWQAVEGGATYKLAESEVEATLPLVDIPGVKWNVRSRLDFNMSKSITQTLHRNEKITVYINNANDTAETPIVLTPVISSITTTENVNGVEQEVTKSVAREISLNTNYLCQAATDHIDVTKVNFGGVADFSTKDFKIKLSEKVLPTFANTSNTALLDNYSNGNSYYTKLSIGSLDTGIKQSIKDSNNLCLSLNTKIGSTNKCGIIMLYCVDKLAGDSTHTCATIKVKSGDDYINFGKFNNTTKAASYTLTPGMHVLEIPKEASSIEIYADTDTRDSGKTSVTDYEYSYQSNIIFSKLSVIYDINPKLNYHPRTTGTSAYTQLLSDIRDTKVADNFYYNCPVDNSNAIEINEFIEDETLASPYVWYDPNNMNNKFVISEIDANYLRTGITLTRSSRV